MSNHTDTTAGLALDPEELDFLTRYMRDQAGEPTGPVAYFDDDGDDDGDGEPADTGDGDGGGEDGDDGDDGDAGNSGGDDGGDGGDGAGSGGDGSDDDDDDEGDTAESGTVRGLRRRLDKTKGKLKTAERKISRLEREAREGRGESEEENKTLRTENKGLRSSLRNGEFNRKVTEVATRLRFKDPALAHKLIDADLREQAVDDEDGDDGTVTVDVDEGLIERELKALTKKHDYLTERPRKKQRAKRNGDDDNGTGGEPNGDGYKFDPRGKMDRGRRPVGAGRGGGGD